MESVFFCNIFDFVNDLLIIFVYITLRLFSGANVCRVIIQVGKRESGILEHRNMGIFSRILVFPYSIYIDRNLDVTYIQQFCRMFIECFAGYAAICGECRWGGGR